MYNLIKKVAQKAWLQHLAFWTISFYLLLHNFSLDRDPKEVDFIFTFLFHGGLAIPVYINLKWAVPQFLKTQRFGVFSVLIIGLIILGIGLNELLLNRISNLLFPQYYFVSNMDYFSMAQFVGGYLLVSTSLKMSRAWFFIADQEKKLLQLRKEKLAAELQLLKGQIQPHFLFNSLNNLYGLAEEKDERAPAYIIKLADLLRFNLYHAQKEYVPLEEEIEQLHNLIDLHALRLDDQVELKKEINGVWEGKWIAPLILINFLENAFKHGPKGNQSGFIHIHANTKGNQLYFCISNTKGAQQANMKLEEGGIGLANVKQRLEQYYPNKYDLTIHDLTNEYTINLKLELDEHPMPDR